jgi:hypothetical protein
MTTGAALLASKIRSASSRGQHSNDPLKELSLNSFNQPFDSGIFANVKEIFRTPPVAEYRHHQEDYYSQQENIRLASIDFTGGNLLNLSARKQSGSSYQPIKSTVSTVRTVTDRQKAVAMLLKSLIKNKQKILMNVCFSKLLERRLPIGSLEKEVQVTRIRAFTFSESPTVTISKPELSLEVTDSIDIEADCTIDIIDEAVEELQRIERMLDSN